MFLRKFVTTLICLICIKLSGQTIPDGGTSLIGVTDPYPSYVEWRGDVDGSPVFESVIVPIADQSFTQAIEVRITNPALESYNGQITFRGQAPVQQNDVGFVHFWARTTLSNDESSTGEARIVVERDGGAYTKSLNHKILPGMQWTEFFFPIEFAETYSSNEYKFSLMLGSGEVRTIQFGGIEFLHFGTSITVDDLPKTRFTYLGRELDAPWRIAADQRIEQYRKGDFSLKLRLPDGTVPDIQDVHFKLDKHAFGFGSVISVPKLLETNAAADIYRTKILELFSSSGPENALKWPPIEGDWGSNWSREKAKTALEWLRLNGISDLRGHVLVWPGTRNLPNRIENLMTTDPNQIPGETLTHIDDLVTDFSPWLNEWDVINEPYDNHDLMDLFGDPIMLDWFAQARASDEKSGLYLNDYSQLINEGTDVVHRNETMRVLDYLIDNNAPITGFGFQGHFSESSLSSMSGLIELYDEYIQAYPSLRFRITEFTISGDDLDLKADYTRDILTLTFSYPEFDGLQFWGFWAGALYRPDAAMYDQDWNELPNGTAYRTLVKETWNTEETVAVESGQAAFRGFYGTYDVAFSYNGKTHRMKLPFNEGSLNHNVMLKADSPTSLSLEIQSSNPAVTLLKFPTEAGFDYQIQKTSDLINWFPMQAPIEGFDGSMTWPDWTKDTSPHFYRVEKVSSSVQR